MTLPDQDEALVHNLASAIVDGYEDFRNADPGAMGWALARQQFDWVVPFHAGAVRYFRGAGVWTDELDAHNNALLSRQEVLIAAWAELISLDVRDDDEFALLWRKLRAKRLTDAGFDPVWR